MAKGVPSVEPGDQKINGVTSQADERQGKLRENQALTSYKGDRRNGPKKDKTMSRSSKKGPHVDPKLLKKISVLKPGSKASIKTWARDSEIAPEMVGFTFAIHNGKDFIEVLVNEDMVGHRLGEFSPTRRFTKHGGKMQRAIEAGKEVGKEVAKEPVKEGGKS